MKDILIRIIINKLKNLFFFFFLLINIFKHNLIAWQCKNSVYIQNALYPQVYICAYISEYWKLQNVHILWFYFVGRAVSRRESLLQSTLLQ